MRGVLQLSAPFVTLYRFWLYNPRNDRLTYLIPVRDAFSGPWATFAMLYWLSTEASSKSYLIGYDADASLPYPHLYIPFFVVCDDGMTRNRFQEKGAYPMLGELMEPKIKRLDPHGRVGCTTGQALSALLAQASSVPVDGRSTTRMANAVAHCSCV